MILPEPSFFISKLVALPSISISAIIDADIEKLKELLDQDLTYSHTQGWTETKLGYLETVKSKKSITSYLFLEM